jgi:hypothetical protein
VYLAWAFVYSLALIDDSLRVHEALGEPLSALLGGVAALGIGPEDDSGLRMQDVGELLVYGIYGGIFVFVLGLGFWASNGIHRKVGAAFAVLLGGLALFVVVVDMLDRVVHAFSIEMARVLATAEDGGEMLVVSATVAFALGAWHRFGRDALSEPDPPVAAA